MVLGTEKGHTMVLKLWLNLSRGDTNSRLMVLGYKVQRTSLDTRGLMYWRGMNLCTLGAGAHESSFLVC